MRRLYDGSQPEHAELFKKMAEKISFSRHACISP